MSRGSRRARTMYALTFLANRAGSRASASLGAYTGNCAASATHVGRTCLRCRASYALRMCVAGTVGCWVRGAPRLVQIEGVAGVAQHQQQVPLRADALPGRRDAPLPKRPRLGQCGWAGCSDGGSRHPSPTPHLGIAQDDGLQRHARQECACRRRSRPR